MKKISIVVPCFNEQDNIIKMGNSLVSLMNGQLKEYDYEVVFIDNDSTDNTRSLLRVLCNENKKIKAIFNARNVGMFNSSYYGICQATGDCVVMIFCDFQDPLELIPVFIKEWENGYKIVTGIKTASKENKIMRALRTCYYKLIRKMSCISQIEHFTGFGLYDKSFIDILRSLKDPIPFLRGIVAELGYKRKDIPYTQLKRKAGKTHFNFYSLYDAAMLSFTSYTKTGLRFATIAGFILSFISLIIAVVYLVYKLVYWNTFQAGIAPVVIGVFFFGSLQLFFIGLLGEYVMSINTRIMNRPLVIEEERINFETKE
jgi:polyisoprenyl-phosphate glycosyltransferase